MGDDILTLQGKTITEQSTPPANLQGVTLTMPDNLLENGAEGTVLTIDHKPVEEVKPSTAEVAIESASSVEKPVEKTVEKKEESEVKKDTEVKSVLKAPKTEEKVVDKKSALESKSQPDDTKKELGKLITPIKDGKEKDEFDYAKYSQQEVTNMKNMSRPSREAYAKLIDENKQLQGLKDSTYLQHERAYELHPDYQQLARRDNAARVEGRAWEQALLDIKAGKPFKQPVGFDNNGNLLFDAERPPTTQDEIRIANNLSLCINTVGQTKSQLQQYPQQFKLRVGQDLQAIEAERKNRFVWVADPKLLDYSVETDSGDMKVRDIKQHFKNILPPYLANTPMAEVASDLMVALQIRSAELREALNGKQVATIKQQEAARGEPSSDNAAVEQAKPKIVNGAKVPSVMSLDDAPEGLRR